MKREAVKWRVMTAQQRRAVVDFIDSGAMDHVCAELREIQTAALIDAARQGDTKALRVAAVMLCGVDDVEQSVQLRYIDAPLLSEVDNAAQG